MFTTGEGDHTASTAQAWDTYLNAGWELAGEEEGDESEDCLDPYLRVAEGSRNWNPLTVYVVADALPRAAAAEIQPLCLSEAVSPESDSDSSDPNGLGCLPMHFPHISQIRW